MISSGTFALWANAQRYITEQSTLRKYRRILHSPDRDTFHTDALDRGQYSISSFPFQLFYSFPTLFLLYSYSASTLFLLYIF